MKLTRKDFSNVTACTVQAIVSHIEEVNFLRLPRCVSGLYPILLQLHAIGSLLIIGGKEKDCYLVLNVTKLTNEVHRRLFSEGALSNKPDLASFNIGLLPQSLLQNVLPPYITKECLTQLQYCQEISHTFLLNPIAWEETLCMLSRSIFPHLHTHFKGPNLSGEDNILQSGGTIFDSGPNLS